MHTVPIIHGSYDMKNILRIPILFILLLPALCYAKWNDMQGHPVEDTAWMKSSGDFGAQLLLIGDEKEFFKRWQTPSAVVKFDTVSEIGRGEALITPVIFSGCQADASGKCNVSGDVKILRPDGTVYADMPQVEIWQNKPAPPDGMLELGVGYAKVIIEPSDPTGTYTVEIRVTDHIQKSSFVLTRTFSVSAERAVKAHPQPGADAAEKLSKWLTYYYMTPHSDRDIENIKAMFQSGFFDKPDSVAPLVMFLAEFFRQNKDRIPGWEKGLHEIPQNVELYLLQALWQANTPNALKALENWPGAKARKTIETIRQIPALDLKTVPIDYPAMLDMLWATFMASGDPEYVERIISVLALPTDSNEKDSRINAILLVGAAKWSLSSNALQHELVYKTCQKFTDSSNQNIRNAISEVMDNANEIKAKQGKQTDN